MLNSQIHWNYFTSYFDQLSKIIDTLFKLKRIKNFNFCHMQMFHISNLQFHWKKVIVMACKVNMKEQTRRNRSQRAIFKPDEPWNRSFLSSNVSRFPRVYPARWKLFKSTTGRDICDLDERRDASLDYSFLSPPVY